jgi:hypothetical protein
MKTHESQLASMSDDRKAKNNPATKSLAAGRFEVNPI